MTTAARTAPDWSALRVLRAFAVVLVVLGQGWLIVSYDHIDDYAPLSGFLRASGLGYTMLLVCSGFAVATAALAAGHSERWSWSVLKAWGTHAAVLVGVVAVAAVGVLLINWLDDTDPTPDGRTRSSVLRLFSFGWNYWVLNDPLGIRLDLGALWYFSVDLQLTSLAAVLIWLFGRRPQVLAGISAALVLGFSVWRFVEAGRVDAFEAGLRTDLRADAFFIGVLAAALAQLVGTPDRWSAQLAGGGALVLVGAVFAQAYLGPLALYRGHGAVVALATAMVLGGDRAGDGFGRIRRLWGVRRLGDLGRCWAIVVALSYPFLVTLSRHSVDWEPFTRVLVGLIGFALVVFVVDQVLRPVASELLRSIRIRRGGRVEAREPAATPGRHSGLAVGEKIRDIDGGPGSEPPAQQ